MTSIAHCPEPRCTAPAAVEDRWLWDSSDGPIEHVRTRCLSRHVFTVAAYTLVPLPLPQFAPSGRA